MKELIKVQQTIELFGEKQMDLSTKVFKSIHHLFIFQQSLIQITLAFEVDFAFSQHVLLAFEQ